jgi:hypothetical protein
MAMPPATKEKKTKVKKVATMAQAIDGIAKMDV